MNANPFRYVPGEKMYDLDADTRLETKRTILIVDDEPQFIKWTSTFLESCGFQVDSVTEGTEAIKKIMVSDYTVILCDMVMPNLAGDMFYLAVERVKPHLCRRFIFSTGYQDDPKIDAFIRKVNGLVLWKPFALQALTEAIQVIEKRVAEGTPGGAPHKAGGASHGSQP
jgi:two-component system, cell cycle sensor histidine kinase and response regulator CckA